MLIDSGRGRGTISCCYAVPARARVAQPNGVIIFSFLSLLFQLFFVLCGLCSCLSASSTHQTLDVDIFEPFHDHTSPSCPTRSGLLGRRKERQERCRKVTSCMSCRASPSILLGRYLSCVANWASATCQQWASEFRVSSHPVTWIASLKDGKSSVSAQPLGNSKAESAMLLK
jgi:hypothetical protein